MSNKAKKIRAVRKLLEEKPSYPKCYLHCYLSHFKAHIDTENASRCCLFANEEKAMAFLKAHPKTEITIYKTAGQDLPEWSKKKRAFIKDIPGGMVIPLVRYLTFQSPTLYDKIPFEIYSARLTQEQKEIFAAFSRISRYE